MRIDWHRQHRWSGLALCLFLTVFCISGIVLNHREMVDDMEISRSFLPPFYQYRDWNGGLMRGTHRIPGGLIIYGNGGIWLRNDTDCRFSSFNHGLPQNAAGREIRALAETYSGRLLALTPYALYGKSITDTIWTDLNLKPAEGERLSDMTIHGDSIVVAGRSSIYAASLKNFRFRRILLRPSDDEALNRISAFRTVWALHSGELFGIYGRIVVDLISVIMTILCISGIMLTAFPKLIRHKARKRAPVAKIAVNFKRTLTLHNAIGRFSIILTLALCITGWMLRPPFLIGLVNLELPKIPRTEQDNPNVWDGRLRMIRYDATDNVWLLYTSAGFHSLENLTSVPRKIDTAPPVSVMGLNVWERDNCGNWLCGSFSGLYVWDRTSGLINDFFSGRPASAEKGPPFGKKAVAGFSKDLGDRYCVVLYDHGTNALPQPAMLNRLPMPLWNIALEAHTGRIYFGNSATYFFVFITGAIAVWCLISGYIIRRR